MNESGYEHIPMHTSEEFVEFTHLCTPQESESHTTFDHALPSPNNHKEAFEVPDMMTSDQHQRPSRLRTKPVYLQDYNCASKETAHWCNLIQYNALSSIHKQIVKHIDKYKEPKSYLDA